MPTKAAMTLSNQIFKATKKHKVSANIYTAILMQESGYSENAVYKKCGITYGALVGFSKRQVCVIQDMGIAQINYKTAKAYNFNMLMLFDQEYAILAGAKVLSDLQKIFKTNPRWWTSYNCGTKKPLTRKTCNDYYRSVSRFL